MRSIKQEGKDMQRTLLPRQSPASFIALGSAILVASALLLYPGASTASARASPVGRTTFSPAQKSHPNTAILLHRHVVRVTISNFAFKPAHLVVSPGTRIVWTNHDSDPHTVTSDVGIWSSSALDTDSRFSRTFQQGGTFHYHCQIHPFMHGTVTVKK
jgi:plastocyanin